MIGVFITITLLTLIGAVGFIILYKKVNEKPAAPPEIKVYVNSNNTEITEESKLFLKNSVQPESTVPQLNPAELLKFTPTSSHIKWNNEWDDTQ